MDFLGWGIANVVVPLFVLGVELLVLGYMLLLETILQKSQFDKYTDEKDY